MKLIDQADISASVSPRTLAGKYVCNTTGKITNIVTRMALLDTGKFQFPVSINDADEYPDNSYVVSPLTTYTKYAEYELGQLDKPWLTKPLRWLIRLFAPILAGHRIDQIVQINNWLLSTNLYIEDWHGEDIDVLTNQLTQLFPQHAIGFRSLNRFSNTDLIDQLEKSGYLAIPSRQVYLFDGRAGPHAHFLHHHNTRIDSGLLRKTSYQIVPGSALADEDYPRLEYLYRLLYLEKYCPLNPQFTADWLRSGQQDGWLELTALRTEKGRIDGVLGWFSTDTILTAPVVGYDTTLRQKAGLYRLITQLCLEETSKRRCVLNLSSGAANFKRLRGGKPEIEYTMVYVAHLSARHRMVWRALSTLLRCIGVPLMQKLKL